MIEVRKCMDEQGRIPFDDWIEHVRDQQAKSRIN